MTQFCGPPCAGGHAHLGWSIGRGKRTNISRPKTSNPRSGDRLSSHRGHREEARRRRPRKGSKARRERSKLGTLPRQAAKRPGLDSPPRQGDVEKGGFSWAIPDRNFATVFFGLPPFGGRLALHLVSLMCVVLLHLVLLLRPLCWRHAPSSRHPCLPVAPSVRFSDLRCNIAVSIFAQ